MKYLIISLVIVVGFATTCYSQEDNKPQHRLAIRVNTLGVFNLDVIGDIEYCLSKRVGIFLGGGSEYAQPVFYQPHSWFKKEPEEACKHTNWGVYAGMRISIPFWKFKGLALRPNLFYQRINMEGYCFGVPTVGPAITSYKTSEIGLVLNFAYTQVFAKRFFVEPVIGIGPEVMTRVVNDGARGRYINPVMPFQLNLGVRF